MPLDMTYAEGSRTGGHQPWVAMGAARRRHLDSILIAVMMR